MCVRVCVCACMCVCVWIYYHKKQSFSYDIIIDVYLKPWLIEVQITSLSECNHNLLYIHT